MKKNNPTQHSAVLFILFLANFFTPAAFSAAHDANKQAEDKVLEALVIIVSSSDNQQIDTALNALDKNWKPEFIPQVLETIAYTANKQSSAKTVTLLQSKTGQSFGTDMNKWYFWLWNQPLNLSKGYADFKASLYQNIDPKFGKYFKDRQTSARVRLDEIRWGGVLQDGIPPLRQPSMISAEQAGYLQDSNVVSALK